jgi:lipopolysaccharide export system permease protein
MESYNTKKQKGFRFSHEIFDKGRLISKFKSDFITWDPQKKSWLAENYSLRKLNEFGEDIEKGAKTEKEFGFDPSELILQKNSTNLMNLPELTDFIEKEQIRGADNMHYYLLDLYQRYMTPLTTFILTLIGFSLAIHKKRDGTGLNLVYGFILTTLFILFQKISITFTTNSDLPPFLAILLPNLIFGVFAYYLFRRAES